MSQQANVTVFDGAATPLVHTFTADGIKQEGATITAWWKETLSGVPDEAQLRLYISRTKLKSGVVKQVAGVALPVMETAGTGGNASGYVAPPRVANIERFEKVNYAHPRGIEVNRRLARQILINWENNVTTTVTPVVLGPVAELFDKFIMVN